MLYLTETKVFLNLGPKYFVILALGEYMYVEYPKSIVIWQKTGKSKKKGGNTKQYMILVFLSIYKREWVNTELYAILNIKQGRKRPYICIKCN